MEQQKNEPTFRIGPIRPPSEANSLLLQVTQGCTWNKCKFCELYKETKFRTFSADSIKQDIDVIAYYAEKAKQFFNSDGSIDRHAINLELTSMENQAQNCFYMVINWLMHGGQNVFLQDGNTLALKNGRLSDVLNHLKQTFPQINRITSYGRAESLSQISAETYAELHESGLTRIHSGFESGSDKVLQFINKGSTAEQQILAGKNIKAGGIELSVYFMPGVGGKELSQENALGMARVVSAIDPDFVRMRTAAIKPGTELYTDYMAGQFELCSDDEKVLEIQTLIEQSHCNQAVMVSDHIINLLPHIAGNLKTEKDEMLNIIKEYFNLSDLDRRVYQLLRRCNAVECVADMRKISERERQRLTKICSETKSEQDWAKQMNELLTRYV